MTPALHPTGRIAALLLAHAVAAFSAQPTPVFRAETRLVLLRATVKDQRGELVTGLVREAFTVYENGRPQFITVFRRDDVPVSVGILIDNSKSMRGKRAHVEAAALAFVRASNPQDEMFVASFADKAQVDVPLTSDQAVLEAGLKRLDSIGGTALRDAVILGEEYLEAHAARDQKILLLITDGLDNASAAPPERIRQRAERSEIVVYAVGLLDVDDASRADRARDALDELTEPTGGLAYYPAGVEHTKETVLEIARQIRHQYTIGYAPLAQALDGSYRKLKVVAKGPGRLSVRTRAGYRATRG
jgi:Ca-activated chloride channel family protein